jgi:hypothetical protein
MPNQLVDIYLADVPFWCGESSGGRLGQAVKPPRPETRPGVDRIEPTIFKPYPWSLTISLILDKLNSGQQIDKFYMAGHGSSGEFEIGTKLRWDNDSAIAEFQKLRPFVPVWRTNVYIIGCEVAADGPCVWMPVRRNGKTEQGCVGVFSGDTKQHGYQLLRKLADAINAPVHGATIKLPLSERWPDQLRYVPALTVGPGGAWTFRAGFGGAGFRYGSP